LAENALPFRFATSATYEQDMEQERETPKDAAALLPLIELGNRLGFIYGSEDISMLLYTLVRREMPRNVVELGTGLGVSTFWMGQALKENGEGRIFTFDDGSHWQDPSEVARAIEPLRAIAPFSDLPATDLDYEGYIKAAGRLLGQGNVVTFYRESVDLAKAKEFLARDFPFLNHPVDFVFADIQRGPDDILDLLSTFLPRIAESASIFIDSASTSLTGYLFLEKLVEQLNRGKVPRHFVMNKTPQERRVVVDLIQLRRFTLVHLVERKRRDQNSTAWIKIEPVDYVPYPMTLMKM
jgi:predicted O-methyltransferase YrrM